MSDWFGWQGDRLWLRLRLQPGARQNAFVGPLEDAFKIQIKAPPIEGRANSELIAFLAKAFGVTKQGVVIQGGEKSRVKLVKIQSPARFPKELELTGI